MKVLMFGWEFPPHISGGLGTACYGLTKSLSAIEDLEILFVVPKLYGDEDNDVADLIGAGDIVVKQYKFKINEFWKKKQISTSESRSQKDIRYKNAFKNIDFIEVKSKLQPYLSQEEFEKFLKEMGKDAVEPLPKININRSNLPPTTQVVVLEY